MAESSTFDCVVDANVGIKLFLVEPLSEQVDRLFDHLADTLPARFYVPDLFFVECANILWKYVHRFGYPPEMARQDVADLVRLPVQPVSMAALVEPALSFAIAWQITAYDATYVALAERLALPLVTADETLAHSLAGSDVDVRFVGAWPTA
jgi:predicted nucleic acid-binding protein